jgi:hypothetical protein
MRSIAGIDASWSGPYGPRPFEAVYPGPDKSAGIGIGFALEYNPEGYKPEGYKPGKL